MHTDSVPDADSLVPYLQQRDCDSKGSPLLQAQQPTSAGAQIAVSLAENRELCAQIEQLRADRDRLMEIQRRMMDLLGAKSPDKLVHDLRNVLNERDLLKALVDGDM